jgi:hypothetical protein
MLRFPIGVLALFLCSTTLRADFISDNRVIISVRDQKLMLLQDGARIATYPVSTSKFGLGDNLGRMTTPLGFLRVAKKIGDNAPSGAVFHNRRWTGEVLRPNAPGRDPIVTRIIWLRGLEPANAHAYNRCIYIHGTPEERAIGRPASYGCIRMRSSDVAALYNQVPIGTLVQIVPDRLPKVSKAKPPARSLPADEAETTKEDWTTSARSPAKPAPPPPKGGSTVAQVSGRGA